jgi:hypothetical protein
MKSVFVPMTLPEAKKAVAVFDLKSLGIELVPIPAMGGCVIAIREVVSSTSVQTPHLPQFAVRWLESIRRYRSERRALTVLQSLSLVHSGGER